MTITLIMLTPHVGCLGGAICCFAAVGVVFILALISHQLITSPLQVFGGGMSLILSMVLTFYL